MMNNDNVEKIVELAGNDNERLSILLSFFEKQNEAENKKKFFVDFAEVVAKIKAPKRSETAQGTKNFSFNYADLKGVIDAITNAITESGNRISFQTFTTSDSNTVSVAVKVVDVNGYSVEYPQIKIPIDYGNGMAKEQCVGKSITYARRYALMSAFNIYSSDNEPNMNQSSKKQFSQNQYRYQKSNVQQTNEQKVNANATLKSEVAKLAETMGKDYQTMYDSLTSIANVPSNRTLSALQCKRVANLISCFNNLLKFAQQERTNFVNVVAEICNVVGIINIPINQLSYDSWLIIGKQALNNLQRKEA